MFCKSIILIISFRTAHLPALLDHNANIIAVYSRSTKSSAAAVAEAQKLGASESIIDIYSDEKQGHGLDELLQRKDIVGVVVALPILVQPGVVRRALAAGKHVLCEKPIAQDVDTAAALISEYEAIYAPRGTILSVAEQFRYDIAYGKAKEAVASGTIGALTAVHGRVWGNIQPGTNKWYETEWRKEPEYQGGFILDGGVHFVALIRYVSGQEVVETVSFTKQTFEHLPPIDTVNSALRFSDGSLGSLSICFASGKGLFEFYFIGNKGSITIKGVEGGTQLLIEDVDGKVQSDEIIDGKGVSEEIKAFLHAVETGKAEEKAGVREALADIAVIESICSRGGKVKLYSNTITV